MILEPSKIKWVLNPRLKYSIKYKKQFLKTVLEVPSFFEHLPYESKAILVEYVNLKLKRKRIPADLRMKFSALFPDRKANKRSLIADHSNFHLENILLSVSKKYFSNEPNIKSIGWSGRKSKRLLGKYYEHEKSIVLSSYLNNELVPSYVIEYIVYHEVCHQFYPPYFRNGRRHVHHNLFKENEKKFEYYSDAKNWIKNNIK